MTPWTAARLASLSIINSRSPLKPTSIELVMQSNHLILCRPRLLLPSIFHNIRGFSKDLALHTSPSNEHPGLISFMVDWLDLLAVQGVLESLLKYHSLKALILWLSAFFMVNPHIHSDHSFDYMELCLSLLFSAIFKASLDSHFAFFIFFFFEIVLVSTSCTMLWTSVHSSSGTLSDLTPWLYLSLLLYNHKGFELGHIWMT